MAKESKLDWVLQLDPKISTFLCHIDKNKNEHHPTMHVDRQITIPERNRVITYANWLRKNILDIAEIDIYMYKHKQVYKGRTHWDVISVPCPTSIQPVEIVMQMMFLAVKQTGDVGTWKEVDLE